MSCLGHHMLRVEMLEFVFTRNTWRFRIECPVWKYCNEWQNTFLHQFAPINGNWPITVLRYISSLEKKSMN